MCVMVQAERDQEKARADAAEDAAASLQREVAEANVTVDDQRSLIEKVGKEALDMREAMRSLKESSAQIAVRAQQEADKASAARAAAEAEMTQLKQSLASEMDAAEAARRDAKGLKAALTESRMALASAEEQLTSVRAENDKLRSNVSGLTAQMAATERMLNTERSNVSETKAQVRVCDSVCERCAHLPTWSARRWGSFAIFCAVASHTAHLPCRAGQRADQPAV